MRLTCTYTWGVAGLPCTTIRGLQPGHPDRMVQVCNIGRLRKKYMEPYGAIYRIQAFQLRLSACGHVSDAETSSPRGSKR